VNVLGLDLSLSCTGWATATETGTIKPKATLRGLDRLRWIARNCFLEAANPNADLIAIEGPAPSKSMGHVHERGGLWWMVVNDLDTDGFRIVVVGPTTLKKYATGRGNAGKDEVLLAAARRFPWFKGGNDEADALWLAAIAAELSGQPIVTMPAANRVDLASKVTRIREKAA
jgi:crossover junction endodeoxyribonuclease RuvC